MTEQLTHQMGPDGSEHAPREKLLSLQILRGLAASAVVIHHVALAHFSYGGGSSWITRSGLGALGASGVDLFFIISGFIMMYNSGHERGVTAAKTFLVRRARRIFPLYWTWTTFLLILWKANLLFTHTHYGNRYIVCSYLLLPLRNVSTFHPVLDPGWTLTLEMFFYVIFGFTIALSFRISPGIPVIVALLGSNLLGHLFAPSSSLRYLLANNLMMEFGMGIAAAYLVQAAADGALPARFHRWLAWGLIPAGVSALLVSVRSGEPLQWRVLIWGLPCFCILLGTMLLPLQSPRSLLTYLGDSTYSIYLGHFLLVVVYATAVKKHLIVHWLPADAEILLVSAAIVAVSSLGYVLLEKPELRWMQSQGNTAMRLPPGTRPLNFR